MSCASPTDSSSPTDKPDVTTPTATDKIDDAADGDTVDLGEEVDENVTINTSVTIKGTDFNGKTITVTKAGVTLENISNATIIVANGVDGGDLTIKSCTEISLTITDKVNLVLSSTKNAPSTFTKATIEADNVTISPDADSTIKILDIAETVSTVTLEGSGTISVVKANVAADNSKAVVKVNGPFAFTSVKAVKADGTEDDMDVSYVTKSDHLKVEPCADGIKVTFIYKSTDPAFTYTPVWINMRDRFEIDLGARDENGDPIMMHDIPYSFIYPLTKNGNVYTFETEFESANSDRVKEKVTCKAAGGIGELNYSDFDSSMVSYVESTRKFSIPDPEKFTSCTKDLTTSIAEGSGKLNIELVANNDKQNGWGEWITGQSFTSDNPYYEQATSADGIDMLTSGLWWMDPADLDATLTRTDKSNFRFICTYIFNLDSQSKDTCPGQFRSAIFDSADFTYTPPVRQRIKAEPDPDGIRITITKYDTDFEWGYYNVQETSTGIKFEPNYSSFEDEYSFVYPLVTKGTAYTFNLHIEKNGNRHLTYEDSITCTANGGIGSVIKPDYTIGSVTLSTISANESRISFTPSTSKEQLSEVFTDIAKIDTAAVAWEIASGPDDWGDDTEWVYGSNIPFYPEPDEKLTNLCSPEGINIYDTIWFENSWMTLSEMKSLIARHELYFADIFYRFTLKNSPEYEEGATFCYAWCCSGNVSFK